MMNCSSVPISLYFLCDQSKFANFYQFWNFFRDYSQTQWENFLYFANAEDKTLWTFGILIYTTALYWILGGFFMIVDRKGLLKQYKIQPQSNESTNISKLLKTIKVVLLNFVLINIPITIFHHQTVKLQDLPNTQTLPTLHRLVFDLIACTVVREFFFYYGHRLMHQPLFYKLIHKRHHEWTAPIAIAATYCHPIEQLVCNILPLSVTVLLLKPHLLTTGLFYTTAIVHTIVVHSGYHLPFLPSPESHDFHHARFNNCFGIFGFVDRLHGTDEAFRKSREFDRHHVTFGLAPVRELFPDFLNDKNDDSLLKLN